VVMNTYFPPNRPSPLRSYQFGLALRKAIESYKSDLKIGIVASGGLSHFVVDEEIDNSVLDVLRNQDESMAAKLDLEDFQHGTSESLCWLTAGAICEGLRPEIIDYVPAYRTQAGTGCGMAMARWLPT
jgi:3-O-methylgallate 3,4-dioxygenase